MPDWGTYGGAAVGVIEGSYSVYRTLFANGVPLMSIMPSVGELVFCQKVESELLYTAHSSLPELSDTAGTTPNRELSGLEPKSCTVRGGHSPLGPTRSCDFWMTSVCSPRGLQASHAKSFQETTILSLLKPSLGSSLIMPFGAVEGVQSSAYAVHEEEALIALVVETRISTQLHGFPRVVLSWTPDTYQRSERGSYAICGSRVGVRIAAELKQDGKRASRSRANCSVPLRL